MLVHFEKCGLNFLKISRHFHFVPRSQTSSRPFITTSWNKRLAAGKVQTGMAKVVPNDSSSVCSLTIRKEEDVPFSYKKRVSCSPESWLLQICLNDDDDDYNDVAATATKAGKFTYVSHRVPLERPLGPGGTRKWMRGERSICRRRWRRKLPHWIHIAARKYNWKPFEGYGIWTGFLDGRRLCGCVCLGIFTPNFPSIQNKRWHSCIWLAQVCPGRDGHVHSTPW